MDLREVIAQIEKTFGIIGIPVLAAYVITIGMWALRRKSVRFKETSDGWFDRFRLRPSPKARRAWVIGLSAFALLAYLYCVYCGKSITEKAGHDAKFLHILVSYSLKTFPYFIAGCVLSAVIERFVRRDSRWLPKSMLGAGVFASILPICSCAAVPFSYSLMMTKRIPLRAVITFMMVVPVLNPFVIVFAGGVLGWTYVFWRVVSIFVLGMVTGVIVERFTGQIDPEMPEEGCTTCKGCSSGGVKLSQAETWWDAAYMLITYLSPYIIIGMMVGAAFTVYLPPYVVGKYLSSSFFGLVLASGVGVPIFLCSGEDVLILAPLTQMGLPMGHAIALTLAGNGICLSSIALLVPLFGKKATPWIIASFFFGSIAIGLFINAVTPLLGW